MTKEELTSPEKSLHSVKAIILDGDGKLLLIRRSVNDRWRSGYWELPGGKAEGADFKAELSREVLEETGFEVEIVRDLGRTEYSDPDELSFYPNTRFIKHLYLCQIKSGQLALSEEHDDFCWLSSLEECRKLPITDASSAALKIFFQQNG